MTVPSRVTAAITNERSRGQFSSSHSPVHLDSPVRVEKQALTLHILSPLVTNVSRNIHRVTNERVPTRVLHGCFELRVEVDHVDSESSSFGEGAVLVVGGFGLDAVERDKGCLAETLGAEVLEEERGGTKNKRSAREGGGKERTRSQRMVPTLMHSIAVFS